MALQSRNGTVLRIGLEDELLIPSSDGTIRGPVLLSTRDAVQILDSIQDLIYFIVATRANYISARNLTDQDYLRYSLVVSDTEIGSFFFNLKPSHENDALAIIEIVTRLLEWLPTATSQISGILAQRHHDSRVIDGEIDEFVPDLFDLFAAAIPLLGNLHPSQALLGFALITMGKLYKVAVLKNHRLRIENQQETFRPSFDDMSAVLEAQRQYEAWRSKSPRTEERPFPKTPGLIISIEPAQRAIFIQFRDFFAPVRCRYNERDAKVVERLRPDYQISITGQAVYMKGAPNGTAPEVIAIDDISITSYQHDSYFKL